MLNFLKDRCIYIYNGHIDFRKQVNGLVGLVVDEMSKSPNDGSLYVFRNRQRNKLKVLVWDRNGFVLGYKRLEKGHFDFPKVSLGVITISKEELVMLVSGMPLIYGLGSSQKEVYFS